MDRILLNNEKTNSNFRKVIYGILVVGMFGGIYYLFGNVLKKKGEAKEFHIVKVEKGKIRQTLTASGTVVASSEIVINSPIKSEIEEVHLSTGAEVEKGDLILKLEQSYTSLEYERLEDELSLRKNNISRLKLQFDKDLIDLEYRDQIKALELNELEAKLNDQDRLLKIGGATEEELEAAQLKLSIAKIEKSMLENELSFKRQVNSTDKDNLQLEYSIQQKRLKELGRKLKETSVKAINAGVITWINEDIGKTVNEGEPLVKIANLNRFEIEASTSDRNTKDLQIGLAVEVRIGKERLKGSVARILPEIINNTINFTIKLEENNHSSLRPSLRAEIYIIINEKNDVLRAKRGNALKGTKTQFVYKVKNNTAIKKRITKGLVSSEYFEIIEGLTEGDQIIISETEDFNHMDNFVIE